MGYSKLTWVKTYKLELVLLGTAKWARLKMSEKQNNDKIEKKTAGKLTQVWSTRPVCFFKSIDLLNLHSCDRQEVTNQR